MKTTLFCVLIHCSADCWLFPQAICPGNWPLPPKTIGLKTIENNRKISITKQICITIDSPQKIPGRKPDSEAGCIFENFTPKQGNSLKILAAGTRNHGLSLPPRVNQTVPYLDNVLSTYLSAYRKGYSRQHVLLRLIEKWRQCLDQNKVVEQS